MSGFPVQSAASSARRLCSTRITAFTRSAVASSSWHQLCPVAVDRHRGQHLGQLAAGWSNRRPARRYAASASSPHHGGPIRRRRATAGGIPVSTPSLKILGCENPRIPEHQRLGDGWVGLTPRINARLPRERGAHNDTARIHAVNVFNRASTPNAYKLVQASG